MKNTEAASQNRETIDEAQFHIIPTAKHMMKSSRATLKRGTTIGRFTFE